MAFIDTVKEKTQLAQQQQQQQHKIYGNFAYLNIIQPIILEMAEQGEEQAFLDLVFYNVISKKSHIYYIEKNKDICFELESMIQRLKNDGFQVNIYKKDTAAMRILLTISWRT